MKMKAIVNGVEVSDKDYWKHRIQKVIDQDYVDSSLTELLLDLDMNIGINAYVNTDDEK